MTKTDTGAGWNAAFLEPKAPSWSSKYDMDISGKVPRTLETKSTSPSSSCLHRSEV